MTLLKKTGIGVLAVVLVVAAIGFDFLRRGGQFRTLAPHFSGSCVTLPLQASSEDIQIDRPRGIAYLSYLDRRAQGEGKPVLGTVMLLDLSQSEPRPRPALGVEPPNFRPQGMSLYRAGDGSERLFVISHPPGAAHSIEVFEQSPTGAFTPVRSIVDPLLASPDAIVAAGPNQFYVINGSGAGSGFGRVLETVFHRGLSTLLFYDGDKFRVVDSGIAQGTGIAMSLDGSQVYVSESGAARLRVYARKPASGDVALVDTIDLGSAPDNINVAGDGSLWIAAHPAVPALLRHLRDANKQAPTQVFRLQPGAPPAQRLKEIYLDAGGQISGGSVAAAFGNEMLVGAIADHRLLRCRVP